MHFVIEKYELFNMFCENYHALATVGTTIKQNYFILYLKLWKCKPYVCALQYICVIYFNFI